VAEGAAERAALAQRAAEAQRQAEAARGAVAAAAAAADAASGRADFAGAERDALRSELGELRVQVPGCAGPQPASCCMTFTCAHLGQRQP